MIILHFVNFVNVCSFMEDEFCLIHLYACHKDVYLKLNWVFLGKEKTKQNTKKTDLGSVRKGILLCV